MFGTTENKFPPAPKNSKPQTLSLIPVSVSHVFATAARAFDILFDVFVDDTGSSMSLRDMEINTYVYWYGTGRLALD